MFLAKYCRNSKSLLCDLQMHNKRLLLPVSHPSFKSIPNLLISPPTSSNGFGPLLFSLCYRYYSTKQRPPTREEAFLSSSKSYLHRLGLKLKWILLRQNRPFNVDEISAFLSWILMGNFIWIFIGTTTFFGIFVYLTNFLGDGKINKAFLKKLITFDNNLHIDIDQPDFKATWEDGKIKFNNVIVKSSSQLENQLSYILKIPEINLTLSFGKWFDGKGLVKDIEILGLTGTVNISGENELIMDDSFPDKYELDNVRVMDSKIEFQRSKPNRLSHDDQPLELILFKCEMDKLRRSWMVYDFLNANTMSGSLGGSLFTLHKRQHQFAHFSDMDYHDGHGINSSDDNENTIWKKTTRLRIDMLDLSYLNNGKSKLDWIESGKAEVIFDIMLPNEDDDNNKNIFEQINVDYTWSNIKESFNRLIEKYIHNKDSEIEPNTPIEQNKYVVLDMKINCFDLTAKYPEDLPHSDLTNAPYISSQDLRSLVTFINDEKFGLASAKLMGNGNLDDTEENPFDGSEIDVEQIDSQADIDSEEEIIGSRALPPIKFRIVQNLNDFEYVDLPSLLMFATMKKPDEKDKRSMKSYVNTNKFIDSSVQETLGLLLLYKEEIQMKLIDMYTKRTGFEILFNNFILGNLILVGLGSFVI